MADQDQQPGPRPNQGVEEQWKTRIGVILAVAGSAIGLGNFLRFPSVAAEWGGGAFMIPYLFAFVLIGLPVALVEWSIGRYGGRHGYNSLAGIFHAVSNNRYVGYLGVLGLLLPVMVYTYYIYVVGWCLGYAWFYLSGRMTSEAAEAPETFFATFVGADQNGAALTDPLNSPLIFVLIAFVLNFILIYRGISRGIELFCRWAMPTLLVIAVIILLRVLTLGTPDPAQPQQNVLNGLGYMWNPVHQAENLAPGDDAVAALVKRSTSASAEPITRDGAIAGLRITQPAGLAWALKQSGWKRDQSQDRSATATTAPATKPTLTGQWVHGQTDLTLKIDGDRMRFTGVEGGTVSTANENQSLKSLLEWLPRDVASAPKQASQFDSIDVDDRAAFEQALSVTGWSNESGVWTHQQSRLTVDVKNNSAAIRAPGFWATLADGGIWLAAAGQIFFSLSVGFGVIVTYASYMQPDDDVMLSGVTAATGNGFCELVLAGLTIVPAGFIFLGTSFVADPPSTFGMGFVSLPDVFNRMPAGWVFGFLFFFLLFLAAMTSTVSLLQPGIAFLEEGLGLGRRASVAFLGLFTAIGAGFVMFFSEGHTALGTIDFWTANVGITVLATMTVIIYGWVLGVDNGLDELRRGAEIPVPRILHFVIRYISPLFLLGILIFSFASDIVEQLIKVWTDPVVGAAFGLFLLALIFFLLLVMQAINRWQRGEPPLSADEREALEQEGEV